MISLVKFYLLNRYVYQLTAQALPLLLGIVVSSVIVQSAGIDVFGEYSLMLALISVTFGVLGSALDTDYQRSCIESNISNVLSAKLVAWLFILPLGLVLSTFLGFKFVASLLVFTGVLFQNFVSTRMVQDRIGGRDIRTILPRLTPVVILLILSLIYRPETIFWVSAIFLLSWVSSYIYLHQVLRNLRINIGLARKNIFRIAPIWMSLVMTQFYGNVDLYIIGFFHSNEVVGIYRLAYTFSSIAMPIAGVLCFIYLSDISESVSEMEYGKIRQLVRSQLAINGVIGIAALLAIIFIFPYVASFLYRVEGEKLVMPAIVLGFAMILNMLTMVYSYTYLALHQEKLVAVLTALGAIFYFATSLFLIPKFAEIGAGIAMTLTYLLLLILYRFLLDRGIKSAWQKRTESYAH